MICNYKIGTANATYHNTGRCYVSQYWKMLRTTIRANAKYHNTSKCYVPQYRRQMLHNKGKCFVPQYRQMLRITIQADYRQMVRITIRANARYHNTSKRYVSQYGQILRTIIQVADGTHYNTYNTGRCYVPQYRQMLRTTIQADATYYNINELFLLHRRDMNISFIFSLWWLLHFFHSKWISILLWFKLSIANSTTKLLSCFSIWNSGT